MFRIGLSWGEIIHAGVLWVTGPIIFCNILQYIPLISADCRGDKILKYCKYKQTLTLYLIMINKQWICNNGFKFFTSHLETLKTFMANTWLLLCSRYKLFSSISFDVMKLMIDFFVLSSIQKQKMLKLPAKI